MTDRNLDREIQTRIDTFLHELSTLVKEAALNSVQRALSAGPRVRRARTSARRRSAGPARSRRRGRRSSAEVEAIAAKVLTHVGSNPGQRLEEIGVVLGTPTRILKRPVAKLVKVRKLRTTGQRRGMRYFRGRSGRVRARRRKA